MTMTAKSRRRIARSLRWFSAGHAGPRSNIKLSSQTVQDSSSFDAGHRHHIHSLMRRIRVDPCARSHSLHASASLAALKSP
jgi:hypothetical protein